MKKTFIRNINGNLINIAHVVTISVAYPKYEQTSHRVVAQLTYGTSILFDGTEEECKRKLDEIYNNL